MKSFKKDLGEAISLVSNIEDQLKINFLNGNEKVIFLFYFNQRKGW
ncbi:hypothetical protein N8148_02880 [Gammaproteobacteria bacterium]|nr:hypothetical protein [Gammaproteobacteria bacterium]